MRKYIIKIVLLIIGITFLFPSKSTEETSIPISVAPKTVEYKGNLTDFMFKVSLMESNNNSKAVNRIGMLGKYQFSPRTLRGYGIVNSKRFLNDESLQDSLMFIHTKTTMWRLRRVIEEFDGTWKDGIYITKSGIVGGAHLIGVYGVLSYFYPDDYKYPLKDGNGTHVTKYIRDLGGYYLEN